ncbi:hypothetical protein [Emticicia agri]|uniref:Lipocalin-like domain-containing protein n=1 Tax=Emticicia agri TaxID=2492393 RepID=A0A4Q5LVE3_9BACT|nr:hypothetical protein [Emticicia agri]RYU93696.1 hypothetical protein EWM59_20895 [Emticicia agri]
MKTILLLFLLPTAIFAQIGSKVQASKTSLAGKWTNKQFGFAMILQLNADGSGMFDEEKITYTTTATTLSVKQDGETTNYKYVLQNGQLTLSGGDLDAPITFSKGEAATSTASSKPASDTPSGKSNGSSIVGTWSGNGETMIFQASGQGSYNGVGFQYSTSGNNVSITGSTGTTTLQYAVNGNYLTLSGNGTTAVLQKGTANGATSGSYGQAQGGNTGGGIDQSIVGKWCWANTSSTSSSSYNSTKCIVINGNGTYEYYAEGSISGYGGGGYGGSNSQSSDRGTWKVEGNRIHVQSQAEGYKVYSFEKRNHPKNGDPMIVIDGDTYVTYYKKAPWR